MIEIGRTTAEILVWVIVGAAAALMAWRLWRTFGRADGGHAWLRYWYYGPVIFILGWVVLSGGLPDYWESPFVYLRTLVQWLAIAFLGGEGLNWLVGQAVRLGRRRKRPPRDRKGRGAGRRRR